MSVKIETATYANWGNCVKMSANGLELYATLDIGPRIIRYAPVGGANVFFEDVNDVLHEDLSEYGWYEGGDWHIHGGHRLWTSPESMPRSYYADNLPIEHEINGNTVILKQRVQEKNNVQLTIEITMDDNGAITANHKVQNKGAWDVELAPWALSVLAAGGFEVVPQTKRDTGLLGNRVLGLWPYSNMADNRVRWGDKYITLKQDKDAKGPFKFGSSNEDGYSAYFNNGNLFVKKYTHIMDAVYPDFGGCSFETFTNPYMLEMESLGPVVKLAPEATVEHLEKWFLYKDVECPADNDGDIEQVMKKYI